MPNNQQPATNNSRTYLVTGAAGFIASKVAEQLLEAGHTVVGIDNLNDYYDIRLKLYRLGQVARAAGASEAEVKRCGLDVRGGEPPSHLASNVEPLTLKFDRFTFRRLDIENIEALERVFAESNFSAVFNLAARAGVRASIENPAVYWSTNVTGEENVLKCQVKFGVKKHVLASSSSVYAGCPMPFTEDAKLGPGQSPYAETKKAAEALARQYHEQHGLDVTVLRYFTVFGPAGRPDMAPFRFIKWIDEGTPITLYGDGSAARDFTYIDDIARGTVLAGQLFGGKLAQPKAEGGKLKAESSDQETGRRLGGDGEANLKPEDSDNESGRRLGADGEAKLKAEGSESNSGFRSHVSESKDPSAFSFQPSAFPIVAPSYEVINLGGGNNPMPMTAVIALIEQALGKKAAIAAHPPSSADMPATWAQISKARHLFDWKPAVNPGEGYQLSVDWHRANRQWLVSVAL